MKTPFLLALCLLFTFTLSAQSVDVYKALKAKHQSVLQLQDSIIYFEALTKNRFKKDTVKFYPFLYKIGNSGILNATTIYGEYKWDKSGYYFKYFTNDSFKKLEGDYSMNAREDKTPGGFNWLFRRIPTIENYEFSRKNYREPTYRDSNGLTIIEQFEKTDNRSRLLYVNEQMQILKMLYINYDTTEADEYWEFRFRYLNGNNFDSLSKQFKLGTYTSLRTDIPLKSVPKKDTLPPAGFSIPLLGNKILKIDSTKETYILLDYWYFGCGPCMQMMPFMNSLDKRADSTRLHIIGANPYDKASDITNYFSKRGMACHQMDLSAIKPFHEINEHPTLILLDSKLNEVKRWVGYSPYQQKLIEKYLLSLQLIR